MKTNQILLRKMGAFDTQQRTDDGYFNATELLRNWNKAARSSGDPKAKTRDIDTFWRQEGLTDLMSEIAENELSFKSVDFTDLKKTLSKTSRGKHNGGTWMHPILFVKFAMYLNPRFEYHVLRFVSDQMLQYRNEAGDAYRQLASAVAKIVRADKMRTLMPKVSEALNYIVYGKHAKMIRNIEADEGKLKDLLDMEKKVASVIEDGFVRSDTHLMEYLRNQWRKRNTPKVFEINN